MKTVIEIKSYKRCKKGGSKKIATVSAHKRSREASPREYTEVGFKHLIKSGFFGQLKPTGKTEELINTEEEVELLNPKGEHLHWFFKEYADGEFYAVLFVHEYSPVPHMQLLKECPLGKDKDRAIRGWNSIIRHRRDLNKDTSVVSKSNVVNSA